MIALHLSQIWQIAEMMIAFLSDLARARQWSRGYKLLVLVFEGTIAVWANGDNVVPSFVGVELFGVAKMSHWA